MMLTLYDLYSYNEKHNEKNGWNNTDGDNNGHSWNCGAEGETDDPNVNGLRRRLIKNAFAALLCSRGPAMFFAGDESATPSWKQQRVLSGQYHLMARLEQA